MQWQKLLCIYLYFRYAHFSEASVFQGNLFCNQKKRWFRDLAWCIVLVWVVEYNLLFQMYNISIYTLLYHHIIPVSWWCCIISIYYIWIWICLFQSTLPWHVYINLGRLELKLPRLSCVLRKFPRWKLLCWWVSHVDGRNPAPVDIVNIPFLTMYFRHPRWCRIPSINSILTGQFN